MEFLCPSCQKMLTVPEQFAGQPMKCPLCGNSFQAPSLAPAPIVPTPDPKAETHVYSVVHEPEPAAVSPAPPKPPKEKVKNQPDERISSPSTASSPPIPAGEYGKKFTLVLQPKWLPYIPAGALVVIFFLTFFSWVGAYPNGLPDYRQNAWQAAFNSYSSDYENQGEGSEKLNPGVSWLTLLWLLIFLLVLAWSVAVVVIPHLELKIPPSIKPYWPWRMIIICGVSLFLLLLMILLDVAHFPLEDKLISSAKETAKNQLTNSTDKTEKNQAFIEASLISARGLQHTNTFRLVFFLLIVTVVCALIDYWTERRGSTKPLPRIDILW